MEYLVTIYDPANDDKLSSLFEIDRKGDGVTRIEAILWHPEMAENYCAYYDFQPVLTDALLDVVIYQPFSTEPSSDEPTIWNAPDVAQLRASLVGRIAAAKARLRPQGPNQWKTNSERKARLEQAGVTDQKWYDFTDDALQRLREHQVIDLDVIEAKREIMERSRAASQRRSQAPRGLTQKASRLDMYRHLAEKGRRSSN